MFVNMMRHFHLYWINMHQLKRIYVVERTMNDWMTDDSLGTESSSS